MVVAHLSLKRVANVVLKDRIYHELKSAITSMNVYMRTTTSTVWTNGSSP